MSKMIEHPITLHHLPLPEQLELLRIEELVIGYQNSWSVDLGALCYLRRSRAKRKPGVGRVVDLTSYCGTRATQIRNFARAASDFYSASGLRVSTIFGLHSSLARFLDWCDDNSHSDALATKENARLAFRSYSNHLREQVDQNALHLNTAAVYQKKLIAAMETHFGFENLEQGVRMLPKSKQLEQATMVPHEEAQAQVLAWCTCLFSGLSELAIERKAFPFALSIPAYLKWPEDRLWVFPLRRWCETPKNLNSSQKYMAYDFQNGRVRDQEQIVAIFGRTKFPTIKLIARAEDRIAAANLKPRDYSRIDRAVLAMQSFFLMFIAITGMNLTQASELPWSEELDASVQNPLVERQGFRTIKYRANNRKVAFELGIQHMPSFKRYLELRKYFLNGRTSEFLFHGGNLRSGDIRDGAAGRGKDQVQTFFKTLHRLCPDLPKVLPKQWRAAKQDFVVRHFDPDTAATAMQHSKATALKYYSNGSETLQREELRSYLDQVERVAIRHERVVGQTESRSIGACSAPNKPKSISNITLVAPDCIGPVGCLFCDKYRIHLDRTDLRKLLSARYCLRKTGATAESHEQFQQFFGSTMQRIEVILAEMRQHDALLVEEVAHDVDINGELDHYWAAKLELLVELEIL